MPLRELLYLVSPEQIAHTFQQLADLRVETTDTLCWDVPP
jgi:hypothetical protein